MGIKQVKDGCWTFGDGDTFCYPYSGVTGGRANIIRIDENGVYLNDTLINCDIGQSSTGYELYNLGDNLSKLTSDFLINAWVMSNVSGGVEHSKILNISIKENEVGLKTITSAGTSFSYIFYYAD